HTPLPDAPLIARTYGWIVPVAPRSIHDWDLASLGTRLDRAQSQIEQWSDIFTIAAATDTIASIRATSRVAAERLLILGGYAAVRVDAVAFGGLRITVADVAALGALAAILLALARGKADATALQAGGGTGVFLLVLPGIVLFVLAVAAARLLSPALSLLELAA